MADTHHNRDERPATTGQPGADGADARPGKDPHGRRLLLKAAGLVAVPLIITVKPQPVLAAGGATVPTNAHGSVTRASKKKKH